MYEEEARKLRRVFGAELVSIHHIGSTAVPGLQAKPVIDTLVVIKDILRIHDFDSRMIAVGYRPRGECLDAFGTPGRFYFSKDTDGIRTHQAHVMEKGHFDIKRKLDFRDYLRAHPDEAETYGTLKERLAAENTQGVAEYIEGKDGFVKAIIAKAKAWKNEQTARSIEQGTAPDHYSVGAS
jgi:GrpB-like predicted nucleotidyltransferase (UPF0157 family)